MTDFFQSPPELSNQFTGDPMLFSYLEHHLDSGMLSEMTPHLEHLGYRAATDLKDMADRAEQNPPRHIPFDAWGNRVDQIQVDPAWNQLKRAAAEEGIVATAYQRKYGRFSRIYQMTLLYLYHPSSAIFSCPLAMTDGAARALELYGDETLKAGPLRNLTSRDPDRFWTSGQWMTERTGGSDVRLSSTIAEPDGNIYRLTGDKWFTSATTSEMACTLARIEGTDDLSLFYLRIRDDRGRLNGITIHRLKDKLGTRALPTAELSLKGSKATLLGGPGHGIRKISTLFNITRIYNSVCAVGYMRRGLALARDYAEKRFAFGRKIIEHPLHARTLADLEVRLRACFQLTFHVVDLLGREETGEANDDQKALLRLLTPVIKLFTARQAVSFASEVLECFGGAGYVEDTGLPRLLRDSQVLCIWEGTTNILSLDALRAMTREEAFGPYAAAVERRIGAINSPELITSAGRIREQLDVLCRHATAMGNHGTAFSELAARAFAMNLARVFAGVLLLEQAAWALKRSSGHDAPVLAAKHWATQALEPMSEGESPSLSEALLLARGG